MKIHKVREPFMCRVGQFEEGKQSLCIGLATAALMSTDIYRCFLGGNDKSYYEISSKKAVEYAYSKKSIWKSKWGKETAILPLFIFENKTVQSPTEAPPKPQSKQEALF